MGLIKAPVGPKFYHHFPYEFTDPWMVDFNRALSRMRMQRLHQALKLEKFVVELNVTMLLDVSY